MSTNQKLLNLMLGVSILVFAGFALVSVYLAHAYVRMRGSQGWATVDAVVIRCVQVGDDFGSYRVSYRYRFEDRDLEGSRYSFDEGSSRHGYRIGQTIPCYVDPLDPSDAVLSRSVRPVALVAVIGADLLGLVGVIQLLRVRLNGMPLRMSYGTRPLYYQEM